MNILLLTWQGKQFSPSIKGIYQFDAVYWKRVERLILPYIFVTPGGKGNIVFKCAFYVCIKDCQS